MELLTSLPLAATPSHGDVRPADDVAGPAP